MLTPPDVLETERLVLRRPVPEDATDIFEEYAQDPKVTCYLTWPPHRSLDETRRFLASCRRAWDEHTRYDWAITLRAAPRVVGMVGARLSGHRAELGYVLARRLWGQGIMTEAARAVVEWLRSEPSIYRIAALCDVDNVASARVMEKLGMQREGVLRRWMLRPSMAGPPRDCLVYSLVR